MKSLFDNPVYLKGVMKYYHALSYLSYLDPNLAYKKILEEVDKFTQHPQMKAAITCGSVKNCSFCCHDIIYMGEVEAKHIKDVIKSSNVSFSKDRVEKQSSGDNIKWADKACPMLQDLDENGERLCSIYENRPIICRTHNNSLEPSTCNKEFNPDGTTQDVSVAQLGALMIKAQLLDKKDIKDVELVPMHQILNEILNNQ
jgi:Fe-S-cluster containining protein